MIGLENVEARVENEKVVDSRRVFDGKLVALRVDKVRLGNGSVRDREVVEHPGAVAVLPILNDGRVVLVRQYRHAVGRTLLEVPAGTCEPGEEPEETARRELEEETGYRAGSLEFLVRFFASPGWATEELVVYVARELVAGASRQEADEDLSLVEVSLDQTQELIASGEIADAKTIVTLLAVTGRAFTSL